MNGSILIIGNNFKEVEQRVATLLTAWKLPKSENNPDLVFVDTIDDKKSIGIGQIKELQKYLVNKPFQYDVKAAIVLRASLLTVEAQNALLKTLEEPPTYVNMILCVEKEGDLLPTILSRCQKIYVTSNGNITAEAGKGSEIFEILNMSLGERFSKAEDLGKLERDEVVAILKQWILNLRTKFSTGIKLQKILDVVNDLENTNVSLKLSVEYLLLNL